MISKKQTVDIVAGLLVYGVCGLIIVWAIGDSIENQIGFILFWAVFMTFAELTILRKVSHYFKNRKIKKTG
jgi:hypothetical protein